MEEEIEELLPQESREAPRDLKPGEAVLITHLNQKGYVLEPPEGNQVQVQVGLMKVTVELDQLQRVASEGPASAKSGTGRLYRAKAREVAAELDLRGLTADEALYQVEKYLDDAYLAGLDQVYLIHGKGRVRAKPSRTSWPSTPILKPSAWGIPKEARGLRWQVN